MNSHRSSHTHCQVAQAQAKTKAWQRACKANAPREIVLKNLPTLKKIKNADTRTNTDRQESEMKITEKLNNDNGLQDWKTEHQAVTKAICNKGFSGNSSILPRIKFRVGGQVSSPQSLTAYSLKRCG